MTLDKLSEGGERLVRGVPGARGVGGEVGQASHKGHVKQRWVLKGWVM